MSRKIGDAKRSFGCVRDTPGPMALAGLGARSSRPDARIEGGRMSRDGLSESARTNEEGSFRKQKEAHLEKLRRAREACGGRRRLAEAAGVTSEPLLDRIEALGLTSETVALLDLLPAVEVAWAERVLTSRERDAIVAIAAELGVAFGSPAHRKLMGYFEAPLDERFFAEAREVLASVIETMPAMEARMRRLDAVDYCREVARASGGFLSRIGLGDAVSAEEREAIGRVSARLASWRPGEGAVEPTRSQG